MSPFWIWSLIILVVVPAVLLWLYSLTDLLRRGDIPGLRRALWVVAIVAVPLLGAALYVVFRPSLPGDIRGFGIRRAYRPRPRHLVAETDDDAESG